MPTPEIPPEILKQLHDLRDTAERHEMGAAQLRAEITGMERVISAWQEQLAQAAPLPVPRPVLPHIRRDLLTLVLAQVKEKPGLTEREIAARIGRVRESQVANKLHALADKGEVVCGEDDGWFIRELDSAADLLAAQ